MTNMQAQSNNAPLCTHRAAVMRSWHLAMPEEWVLLYKDTQPLSPPTVLKDIDCVDGCLNLKVQILSGVSEGGPQHQAHILHLIDKSGSRKKSMLVRNDVTGEWIQGMVEPQGMNINSHISFVLVGRILRELKDQGLTSPSERELWYGLKDVGDGHRVGHVCQRTSTIGSLYKQYAS